MLCSDHKHGQPPRSSYVRFWVCSPVWIPLKASPLHCNTYGCTSAGLCSLCPCLLILPRMTQFLRNLQANKSKWFTRQLVFLWVQHADSLQSVCLILVTWPMRRHCPSVTAWDVLAQKWARSNSMPLFLLFRVPSLKKPHIFCFSLHHMSNNKGVL